MIIIPVRHLGLQIISAADGDDYSLSVTLLWYKKSSMHWCAMELWDSR